MYLSFTRGRCISSSYGSVKLVKAFYTPFLFFCFFYGIGKRAEVLVKHEGVFQKHADVFEILEEEF